MTNGLWLLDLFYKERDSDTAVIMYCKTPDGRTERIEDSSLSPFFLSTKDVDIPTSIRSPVTKLIGGRRVELTKYQFVHPRDVRNMRHLVPPESLYEADIGFAPERYVLSNEQNVSGWNSPDDDGWRSERKNDPPPELTVMSLDFEMYNPDRISGRTEPDPGQDEILMAGVCAGTMNAENLQGDPAEMEPEVYRIDECGSEPGMLNALTGRIQSVDPDILCTYSGTRFDLPYADARASALGMDGLKWGRDGTRLRQSRDIWKLPGRCHLDLNNLVKQTLSQIHSAAVKPLTLKNVAREYLGIPNPREMDKGMICRLWDSGQAGRDEIAEYNASDAKITLQLGLKVLPFAIALSSLTTLPLDHLFENSRGQQVDHYLMKLATERNEAIPMKPPHDATHKKFLGAHVRPPVPGVHRNVSVIDFTSMYPNILMKLFPGSFLAQASRTLFEMKKAAPKDTPQARAIKTVLLAVWGYLGWDRGRWKDFDAAAGITARGQLWIKRAIQVAERYGFEVVYGDTDSLFVVKPKGISRFVPPVPFLAERITDQIGAEARLDKRYQKLFFTETREGDPRMKAYVGLDEKGRLDVRGLDMIRGDVSLLGQMAQEGSARSVLMHDDIPGAVRFTHHIVDKVRRDAYPLSHYIIRKGLNQEEYKSLPAHVAVARRLNLPVGSQVEFVIANGEGKLYQKARHPSEMRRDGGYSTRSIDKEYYVSRQIVPPAMRILKMFGVQPDEILTGAKSVSLDGSRIS